MKVIVGFSFARVLATETVRSYVNLRYALSFIPTADTPRQKKQASQPEAPVSIRRERSDRSCCTISRSLSCCGRLALRTIARTLSTSGSSRHSRRTPYPTIPVAPKRTTFMIVSRYHECVYQSECGDQTAAREALGVSPLMKTGRADASRIESVPLVSAVTKPFVFFAGRPAAQRAADAWFRWFPVAFNLTVRRNGGSITLWTHLFGSLKSLFFGKAA